MTDKATPPAHRPAHSLDLLVSDRYGRMTAAVVRGNALVDLFLDAPETPAAWASLYMGRVAKVDKALDSAIVEMGGGLLGLLPAKHATPVPSAKRLGISQLLQAGQPLVVQVKSEPRIGTRHERMKMPRLTAKIALMGPNMHHTPLNSQVLMSRRIQRKEIIEAVSRLKAGSSGFLVQAAADLAEEKDIIDEARHLEACWREIKKDIDTGGDAPRLLLKGPNAMERALLAYGANAFAHIHVADRATLEQMQLWCADFKPDLAHSRRLRLFKPEKPGQKLFDLYDIDGALEELEDTQVFLPGGGSIIIDTTHALVIIDVNRGNAATVLGTNLEAAREVARQIRLRNLSGAILVDFINMPQRSARAQVLAELEKAFADDNASPQVHGFTRIGIVEITRKRRSGMHSEKRALAPDPAGNAFNSSAAEPGSG